MTHGTRIDINAIKSVLTRWITEGHITPAIYVSPGKDVNNRCFQNKK